MPKTTEESLSAMSFEEYQCLLDTPIDESRDYDQLFVMNRMKSLGYTISDTGMCFGMASMSLQSFLLSEGLDDTASKRLAMFNAIPVTEFANYLERMLQLRNRLKAAGDVVKALQVEATIADFRAFFDGIALSFNHHLYSYLYEDKSGFEKFDSTTGHTKSEELAKQILRPNLLSSEKRRPEWVGSILASFNSNVELVGFLDGVSRMSARCSVFLAGGIPSHTLTLGYDPKEAYFFLENPNHQPGKKYLKGQLDELAEVIRRIFSYSKSRVFTADIYTNNEHGVLLKRNLLALDGDPGWRVIQDLTPHRLMEISPSDCEGLFYHSCRLGKLNQVQALLAVGVSQSICANESALFAAASHGHAAVVSAILEKRDELPQDVREGVSPLSMATHRGHAAVVTVIKDMKAKLSRMKVTRASADDDYLSPECY